VTTQKITDEFNSMKIIPYLILTLASFTAQSRDILIFGGENNKEFLGCMTCNEMAPNSIWNDMSQYGWRNSFGKWNSFGKFKNQFSSYSACNEFTQTAPVLVDNDGNFYGRLTLNEFANKSICGFAGDERVCRALKAMCAT
jgi:hypothetical protein